MVGDAAVVAGTDIGTIGLFAREAFVADKKEWRSEDLHSFFAGAIISGQKFWRYQEIVNQFPFAAKAYCSYVGRSRGSIDQLASQIDQRTVDYPESGPVRGVIEVAHCNNEFSGTSQQGINAADKGLHCGNALVSGLLSTVF